MDIQRLRYLLRKQFTSQITPNEERELLSFLADSDNNPELKLLVEEAWVQSQEESATVFKADASDRMLQQLMQQIRPEPAFQQPAAIAHSSRLPRWTKWAAAAILLLSVGSLFFYTQLPQNKIKTATAVNTPQPIVPGSDGAILTLADGRQVVLDSLQDGTIASQRGTEVVLEDGALSYQGKADDQASVVYNTVSTPNGRQFKLQLADGTQVWLNAASSISYPVEFSTVKRAVRITGEVYFEVAKDKNRPFVVEKDALSVTVTGTHFNINTYDDERTAQVTLLEGGITVKNGNTEKKLLPGQQAETLGNEKLQVHTSVNTEEVVAWKNGYFAFNNSDLKTVMRKLARWYNVEVIYDGAIPDMKFGGGIARSTGLTEVLHILEESKIHFKIDYSNASGNSGKIIVSP